jgi:ferrochelatase
LENIERARQQVGLQAPQIDKLRPFFNHPDFIAAMVQRIAEAVGRLPACSGDGVQLFFTAHSIPLSMARGCRYEAELREAARLVVERSGGLPWHLVYQSRSGPPEQPWLSPDVCDALREMHRDGDTRQVVIVPIGFVSDHLEVAYDLDVEARAVCDELGIAMVRAATVGTHPRFVHMIGELIREREGASTKRPALGQLGTCPDICPPDCCPPG